MGLNEYYDDLGYYYSEMDELYVQYDDKRVTRAYYGNEAKYVAALMKILFTLDILKGLHIDNMHLIRYKRNIKTVVQVV